MSILKPAFYMQPEGSVLSFQQLDRSLSASSSATLRELLHVLLAPPDVPRLNIVLESVCDAVASYGSTLAAPSAIFRLVQASLEQVRNDVRTAYGSRSCSIALEQPLLRRLTEHSPYALYLTLAAMSDSCIDVPRKAAGVEVALRMVTGQTIRDGFATAVRRTLTPELFNIKMVAAKRDVGWAMRTYCAALSLGRAVSTAVPF